MPNTVRQATVSPTILLPQDRIARQPLTPWAARLAAELDEHLRCTRKPRVLAERIGAVANNAALVAAHRGNLDQARALCTAQMLWQLRFSRRAGDHALTALAIQPWVNLGRLDALAGAWQPALARFRLLEAYRTEGVARLGSACLDGSGWAAVSSSPQEFERLLATTHAVDSLKALLLARRHTETLDLCDDLDRAGSPGAPVAAEARVVALCGEGEPRRARAAAAEAARTASGWHRAVFLLRRAEADACAGDADRAADALRRLATTLLSASPRTRHSLQGLHVTARLAAACREAGLDEDACAVARDVHEGASEEGDEAFRIESLRLLAHSAPRGERAMWAGMLAEAENATEYRRYRTGGPAPASPVIDELFARLDEIFGS